MALTRYQQKLRLPQWQKRRLHLLELAKWQCAACGADNAELHVHHLTYNARKDPWDYPDKNFLLYARRHVTFHARLNDHVQAARCFVQDKPRSEHVLRRAAQQRTDEKTKYFVTQHNGSVCAHAARISIYSSRPVGQLAHQRLRDGVVDHPDCRLRVMAPHLLRHQATNLRWQPRCQRIPAEARTVSQLKRRRQQPSHRHKRLGILS